MSNQWKKKCRCTVSRYDFYILLLEDPFPSQLQNSEFQSLVRRKLMGPTNSDYYTLSFSWLLQALRAPPYKRKIYERLGKNARFPLSSHTLRNDVENWGEGVNCSLTYLIDTCLFKVARGESYLWFQLVICLLPLWMSEEYYAGDDGKYLFSNVLDYWAVVSGSLGLLFSASFVVVLDRFNLTLCSFLDNHLFLRVKTGSGFHL